MSDPVRCPKNMVYIPAGTFKMGSMKGHPWERPVHGVYVSSFCIDKHEVTNTQYSSYEPSPSPKDFDGSNQPVVNVNWFKAKEFCERQGKRLPTEAEWEKAARGPEGYEYGTKSGMLNYAEAHYNADNTAVVCSYPENDYGLCDMTGNVWEWVSDWYSRDAYEFGESRSPQGPSYGDYKVRRGGSWHGYLLPPYLYATNRYYDSPDGYDLDIGFRCVADPLKSEE